MLRATQMKSRMSFEVKGNARCQTNAAATRKKVREMFSKIIQSPNSKIDQSNNRTFSQDLTSDAQVYYNAKRRHRLNEVLSDHTITNGQEDLYSYTNTSFFVDKRLNQTRGADRSSLHQYWQMKSSYV